MNNKTQRPTAASETPGTSRASSLGWVPYLVLCAVGLTVGLTSIAPSASEGLGTLNRMMFWAAHVVPALTLLTFTQIILSRVGWVSTLPGIAQVIASAVIASFLFAPLALGIDAFLGGEGAIDDDGDAFFLRLGAEIGHFFVPLTLIWCLINAPSLLQLERTVPLNTAQPKDPSNTAETDLSDENDGLTEFWSRIPGRLGRSLVALTAELHYLRVYTTEGDALILFPFGRAVELLQDEDGMQVHRSHWIALDQVDEVVAHDGRTTCKMIGGLNLPVSRSYRAALKIARRDRV